MNINICYDKKAFLSFTSLCISQNYDTEKGESDTDSTPFITNTEKYRLVVANLLCICSKRSIN